MKLRLILISTIYIFISNCTFKYNIHQYSNTSIDVSSNNIDSNIINTIEPYKAGIDSIMNEVLCISNINMTKGRPESLIGNFVTDLCLQSFINEADICVLNNGGFRSEIKEGLVTRRDLYKLMPFDNELVILSMDKQSYLALIKYIIKRGGEPYSGMEIIIDNQNNLKNDSINQITNIRLLTSDYLANGGDKMSFFKDKKQIKTGYKLRDVIIDYCKNNDTITAKLDNRFTIIE
tara:strand:- start:818 stop:1519 length:702 start_codon:yes stop_codon:yes gene_type:complete